MFTACFMGCWLWQIIWIHMSEYLCWSSIKCANVCKNYTSKLFITRLTVWCLFWRIEISSPPLPQPALKIKHIEYSALLQSACMSWLKYGQIAPTALQCSPCWHGQGSCGWFCLSGHCSYYSQLPFQRTEHLVHVPCLNTSTVEVQIFKLELCTAEYWALSHSISPLSLSLSLAPTPILYTHAHTFSWPNI